MKRYLIPSVVIVTVLAVSWIAVGQPQGDFRQRMAEIREARAKAIEVIGQQLPKLKASMERPAFDRTRFQDMSEEERAQLRETFTKAREQRQSAITTIIAQVAILQGQRQPAEGERFILVNTADLKAVQALAKKEKATQTAERITELLEPRRRGFGGRRGGGRPGGTGG